tara:strand:- start:406 stop:729 length:324 start_codon:yes stop_codon:yes gene_type:complete
MLKGKMSSILKQAQEMQKNMESIQEELGDLVVKSDIGGGMVTATANGRQEILKIEISKEALEEEKEMLEDLVVSSVNRVLKKSKDLSQEKMNSVAGGMLSGLKIPGM